MNWDLVWVPLGGVIVGFLGYWGQRVSAQSAERSKAIESHGPEWQAMVTEIKEWASERLAERDKRIDGLQADVERLATEVDTWKDKYWRAVQHIRALRVTHPEPRPDVPLVIREDV